MLQRGRGPGLMTALFLGGAVMAGCSDSAMGPTSPSAVKFPSMVKVAASSEEVCESITFNDLGHGDQPTGLTIFGSPLTFSGIRYNSTGPDGAADLRILDPSSPLGPDDDLRKTGVGGGQCSTCNSPMLVINDPDDGTAAAPSDNAWGGEILITGFPDGAYIKSYSLADHETLEAPSRLIVNGMNIAPLVQGDGEHEVLTFNTTSTQIIGAGGARFILGNPPTTMGSEAIDNIEVCRLEEVVGHCTYTKGWYQNKNGAPTVIGVDGRSKSEAQQIFAATPGQPGNVKWGVDGKTDNKPNDLLNLYQQFLAALNNLGGDDAAHLANAPAAVATAISQVAAVEYGSGTTISIPSSVTKQQLSGWIETLSKFNEGKIAGFPHCSKEDEASTK